MKYLALDTETTGLDSFHGCLPYFVSTCDHRGEQMHWEWVINPVHRRYFNRLEAETEGQEIEQVLNDTDWDFVIMQNNLFDTLMLKNGLGVRVPWDKVIDTTRCSHILNSHLNKDLGLLSRLWLGIDMTGPEQDVLGYTVDARRLCKKHRPLWWYAKDDEVVESIMPSGSAVKADMWLLKSFVEFAPHLLPEYEDWSEGDPVEHHPWNLGVPIYGNLDTAVTARVFKKMWKEIEKKDLVHILNHMRKLDPLIFNMVNKGVTLDRNRLRSMIAKHEIEAAKHELTCRKAAREYGVDLKIGKGTSNALKSFVFETVGLESPYKTKTGQPSMAKEALEHWDDTLEPGTPPHDFITSLRMKRKYDTANSYARSYLKFARNTRWANMGILYPNYKTANNVTLRFSSQNPNAQNISKQDGFNCRVPYGPAPGRLWAAFDYDNLELRIPAYECQEPAMMELFLHPDKPPYYGSYHLLIFSILHPDKYDHDDPEGLNIAKSLYKATWYQWTKNGNFAELYGAVDTKDGKSTADRAFHVPGAQEIVANRLKEKTKLNQHYINLAQKRGFVETMPDKYVDPNRGYPLQCPKNSWGKVKPTVPLNYHVQGTAMWAIISAMYKIDDYLKTLPGDWHMTLQVHDEVVIDFPEMPEEEYLPILNHIKGLMESISDHIGVTLTSGCTLHSEHWAKGVDLEFSTVA